MSYDVQTQALWQSFALDSWMRGVHEGVGGMRDRVRAEVYLFLMFVAFGIGMLTINNAFKSPKVVHKAPVRINKTTTLATVMTHFGTKAGSVPCEKIGIPATFHCDLFTNGESWEVIFAHG